MKSNLQIILDIDKKVCQLSAAEREDVLEILKYQWSKMVQAEKISNLLGVDYYAIFDLL